mgnify:CR=1 FL=1
MLGGRGRALGGGKRQSGVNGRESEQERKWREKSEAGRAGMKMSTRSKRGRKDSKNEHEGRKEKKRKQNKHKGRKEQKRKKWDTAKTCCMGTDSRRR